MKLKTLIKWQVMPFLVVLLTQGTCDEPVTFVYPIDNITVASGREAIFTCVVDKPQRFVVAWLRADRVLAIHKSLITRDPRIKVSHNGDNTWRLHIHDVQLSDSGPYVCTIKTDTYRNGTQHVSQIGTLEVIEAPEILHNDTSNNTICLESADAVLNCETRPQENHPDNDTDDGYWAGHSREPITWMPVSMGSRRHIKWINEIDDLEVSLKMEVESFVQPGFKGRIPSLTMESIGGAAAYLDGAIYYCGGYLPRGDLLQHHSQHHSQQPSNQCYSLDEFSAQWTISSEMRKKRNHFTLNRVGDKLVAIGGYVGNIEVTATTEILESGGNKTWRYGPNLSFRRTLHCTVTLSDKSVIILGGMTSGRTLVDTVELFDIELDIGNVRLTNLRRASFPLACGLYNGRLIVVDHKGDFTSSTAALDIRSLMHSPSGDKLGSWYDLPTLPGFYRRSTMVITPGRLWLLHNHPRSSHDRMIFKYTFNNSSERCEDNLLNGEWTELEVYDDGVSDKYHGAGFARTTLLVPNNFRCKTC